MGEAHRHEPPVPHDRVVVDEGQDREGPEDDERSHVDEKAPGVEGHMVPPLPDAERERRGQVQALEAAVGLPEDPQKVAEGNGQLAIEPVKEDVGLGGGGLHPGPQAGLPEGPDAPGAGAQDRRDGVPMPDQAAGAAGKLADSEPGGCQPGLIRRGPPLDVGVGMTSLGPSPLARLACECGSPFASAGGLSGGSTATMTFVTQLFPDHRMSGAPLLPCVWVHSGMAPGA